MTDGVHANVGAIQKMEEACGRFARSVLERLPEIHRELRQKTEALEDRSSELRREISRLEDAISSADEDDSTAWERNRLSEAEDELASVQRRRRKLAEAATTFAAQARKVEDLSTGHAIKAQEFLRGAVADVKAYLAFNDSASMPGNSSTGGNSSMLTGIELEEQIARAINEDGRLLPTKWRQLGYEQRIRALQDAETITAKKQLRPPATVIPHFAEIAQDGLYRHGSYEKATNTIEIGRYLLEVSHPDDAVNALIHEGRHAYQHHAVKNPGYHTNDHEVREWAKNFKNYITSKDDPELYYNQAVERDAREYAALVSKAIYLTTKP